MDDGITFSRQVKAARALLGWGQDELARQCGVSPRTLKTVELGGHVSELSRSLVVAGLRLAGVRLDDTGSIIILEKETAAP